MEIASQSSTKKVGDLAKEGLDGGAVKIRKNNQLKLLQPGRVEILD